MKLEIDLKLLEEEKLNINEYLTLFKLNELNKNNDIPFNSNTETILSLFEKEFLISEGEEISLTKKSLRLFKSNKIEEDITEIINYFKQVTGKTKILETSPANRKLIKDRLKENYTIDDLKAVIDVKNKEWAGTSMDEYIRIQTLFNDTKFQKYLSQIEVSSKKESVAANIRRI